ncbi:MAG: nicotinate-nucleotide--dimethylbenzimidazole phosphoribosyltransferase [Rhizobiaceae bacterium]|nr:nicotinate-nucleotide--dimethylbenzimidazole phosphoribosyltransferase [Rhizobiaceae bacterium]MCV0407072.1 nicotinate-nucleotide--dimethylbenzimidazole phosphoribosyltransferase [Rhizobiaceae bacterium]
MWAKNHRDASAGATVVVSGATPLYVGSIPQASSPVTTGLPFDDIRAIIRALPEIDRAAADRAGQARAAFPLRAGGLGSLEGAGAWFAGVTGRKVGSAARPVLALFAGSHEVDEADARAEAAGFVERSGRGEAAVAQACGANEVALKVYDLALDLPVPDTAREAAVDEKTCAATMAFGMEAIGGGHELVALSSVGRGGRISAAALAAALAGEEVAAWLPGDLPVETAEGAARAVAFHKSHLGDPLEALRRLGGRETAAIAGAILAARSERIPVILDGRVAVAAALVLERVRSDAIDHCRLACPLGDERWDATSAKAGLEPLGDHGMPEGEGLAAVFATLAVRTALAIHNGLAAVS